MSSISYLILRIVCLLSPAILASSQFVLAADNVSLGEGDYRWPIEVVEQRIVVLQKQSSGRRVSEDAILIAVNSSSNVSSIVKKHDEVTAIGTGQWKEQIGYFTAQKSRVTFWDPNGEPQVAWMVDDELFISEIISLAEPECTFIFAFDRRTEAFGAWRLKSSPPAVECVASGKAFQILRPQPGNSKIYGIYQELPNIQIVNLTSPSPDGTSLKMPSQFYPVAGLTPEGGILGRHIDPSKRESRIATLLQSDPAVQMLTPAGEQTAEPLLNASGDIAFTRFSQNEGPQELCVATGGRIVVVHKELESGGRRFTWDRHGTRLISLSVKSGITDLRYDKLEGKH